MSPSTAVKHVAEGVSLTLISAGIAQWIPWLLAVPGAVWYCWMLWDKWRERDKRE